MTKHVAEAADRRIDTPRGKLFARLWRPVVETDKAAILLLHDSLGCVDLWRDFPAQLAAATGRAVIAYDRLGFGRSDPGPTPPLAPDFVTWEAANAPLLMQAFGFTRIVPLGHSVGGAMAVHIAAAHPEACTALVTEAAQSLIEERTLEGIRAAKASFAEPGQVERLARYQGDRARWVLDAWTETWLSPGFAAWRLDAALAQVRCPTLAIHGDLDEFGAVEHARRIARLSGGEGRTLLLEKCGHVPHRERPDEVLKETVDFLAAAE